MTVFLGMGGGCGGGMGPSGNLRPRVAVGVLLVVLILAGLKAIGVITWPWWVVCLPVLIPLAFLCLVVAIFGTFLMGDWCVSVLDTLSNLFSRR